jgi:molybdate transport system substrate-binding protein
MWRSSKLVLALLVLFGPVLAACGSSSSTSTADRSSTPAGTAAPAGADPVTGEITVFAAASLTGAFADIGRDFMAAHPGTKVTFSYDGSSALAQQIVQGAPADVFASADTANMAKLTQSGLDEDPARTFATNALSIIVPSGDPKRITGLGDLARPGLKVVLCAPAVPCGAYAAQVLAAAGVTVTPVSLEQNVKGVVTKVTAGEADAGIVYATDVAAAGGAAQAVSIPAEHNVVARYPVAIVKGSKHLRTAEAFVDYLLGSQGQGVLARYGFGPP